MSNYIRKSNREVQFDFMNEPVFIRALKADERWDVEMRCPRDPETGRFVNPGQMLAEMMLAAVVDKDGKPVFTAVDLAKMDEDDLASLWEAVESHRGCSDAKKKNWRTVNGSPSASP